MTNELITKQITLLRTIQISKERQTAQPESPTINQINYLKDRKLPIPATKKEASDAISKHLEERNKIYT